MSLDLVPLAVVMWAVTYPSRAIGLLAPSLDRLPRRALEYLQLVGPAVLGTLAAVNTVALVREETLRPFVPLVAVIACLALVAWRRNLFLGLVVAVAIAIAGRAFQWP
jgi:branched-subunit amino acid transport protein